MLQFAVYDESGPARNWPLVNAHLLGPDDVAQPGKVAFQDGRILCRKRGHNAAALSLMHDAGAVGRLMLQTCLLPDREEPYILSVELARHRIKTFIVKSEEWQLWDLDPQHGAMRHWEEARRLLTKAMISEDPLEADRLAKESLQQGIEASERLAMIHAEILLHRRFASRPASRATLGVRVNPAANGKALQEVVKKNFDLVVVPLRWNRLEAEEGSIDFSATDRWVEWARAQEKPIVAGPLIDFSSRSVPEWMYVWQHDYDTCRDLLYDYMEKVVRRYAGVVGMWNLASGLNVNESFPFSVAQQIELVRTASLLVKQIRRGARTMIELRQPFGEYCSNDLDALPPVRFVERLMHDGVKVDALGVPLLFGERDHGRGARDLMQVSAMLDKFVYLELPLLISAMGVPSDPEQADGGGWWHGRPNEENQSRWMSRVFSIALSKPFVETIFCADLYDYDGAELAASGLINRDGKAKPAFERIVGIRRRLRKPLGPMKNVRTASRAG